MRKFFKSRRNIFPWILFILLVLFNGFLLNLPLTNILGYEFSVFNAVVQFLIGGLATVYFYKRTDEDHNHFRSVISNNWIFYLAVTTVPFLLSFVNTLAFQICPFSIDLLFYFVISIPSYVLGISVALIICFFMKKFSYLTFILVFLIILLLPVFDIYFYQQVYFYNPIVGYFPGTIYDEDIAISSLLIYYRILNLIYFSGVLLIIQKSKRLIILNKAFFISAVALVSIFFGLSKPFLGFATNESVITSELNNKVETEHFVIHYSSSISKVKLVNLILHHEYYFNSINDEVGYSPERKIESFIFDSNEQKRRLFGVGRADVAKPWLYQLYTTYDSYNQTLKHEIAHVFTAEIGVTPFKHTCLIHQ